jgi:alpha-1,3/alpha-1,6-mannosyltransferase
MNFAAFDVPLQLAGGVASFVSALGTCKVQQQQQQQQCKFFLSINRYERKKNHALAIEALSVIRQRVSSSEFEQLHLVIAGGYDDRVLENVEHARELQDLVDALGLTSSVTFLRSVNEQQKLALLTECLAVIYTPSNEHFGIVPVEAMYMRKVCTHHSTC